jgi:hypothetical protein
MATGNIAKNDITGRYIKSMPPTSNYTDNFDTAFKKKTLREWYLEEGIIVDADGDEYDALVGYSEFRTHFKTNQ